MGVAASLPELSEWTLLQTVLARREYTLKRGIATPFTMNYLNSKAIH